MTLREALKKHTRYIMFCGMCECGLYGLSEFKFKNKPKEGTIA